MKKIAYKVFLMLLIVNSLLTSCKKNDTQDKDTFTANIEGNDDKTYLDGLNVKWTEYDQITVANTLSTNITFELTEGATTQHGVFYTGDSRKTAFFTAGGPYKAVYPATSPGGAANTISGTTATVNLPGVQTLTEVQTVTNSSTLAGETAGLTFGVGYNPMVAYSESQTLPFKNLLGGLCFPMKGKGTGTFHVTKIVLSSKNTDDILWGTATVDCTSANPAISLSNTAGNKHQITVNCNIDLPYNEVHKFFFMLPPGTLTTGMRVQVYDGDLVIFDREKTWTSSSTIIERNHLRLTNTDLEVGVEPSVTTNAANMIDMFSARLNGNITSTGGASTMRRGLCWSTSANPTISDSHYEYDASGTGPYSHDISGLSYNTTYHVRAYATNGIGTYYGEDVTFTTLMPYFTTNTGAKVYFAPGNLQYIGRPTVGTAHYWRFALNQYDIIGLDPNPDYSQNGIDAPGINRDLLGWGTDGMDPYFGFKTSSRDDQYYHDGNISGTQRDWGSHNLIRNPKNGDTNYPTSADDPAGTWRTPTYAEIDHILFHRTNISTVNGTANARWTRAKVADHNGLLIFPDYYVHPSGITQPVNINNNGTGCPYTANTYSAANWTSMEAAGAVFLPCEDYRNGTSVGSPEYFYGYYWTSTYVGQNGTGDQGPIYMARGYCFDYRHIGDKWYNTVGMASFQIHNGNLVRLIKDVVIE